MNQYVVYSSIPNALYKSDFNSSITFAFSSYSCLSNNVYFFRNTISSIISLIGCEKMIRVTGEKQKSEIAYAIQKYNKSTIYSYGDFCPSYLDTYMTYYTECDPISFCKFVMENLEEKVRDNEGLPIPMIVFLHTSYYLHPLQ